MLQGNRNNLSRKKNKEPKLDYFTFDEEDSSLRLATINADIAKLYKKYSETRKKRLSKEKTQQILVNRIKYLKSEVNRSISKKDKKGSKNNLKIEMKFEESYSNSDKEKYKFKKKGMEKQNNTISIFNDESSSKVSINGSGTIRKSFVDIKIKKNKNKNILEDKENNQNIYNIMSGRNDIKNILRKNRYNIGNNNSNNNIYIIINNQKSFENENILNNQIENTINSSIRNNITKNYDGQKINKKNLHRKYKSENNFINFSQRNENIILMKADENKLQDIINSINSMNESNSRNFNIKKNKVIVSSQNNENKKIITRNKTNNLLKKVHNKGEFIRPNFLNLYNNNEEASIMKQQIDMNTFNKTESSFHQTIDSLLTSNKGNDKNKEEKKNTLKQKTKKNSVIHDSINNNNANNEFNNFLFNPTQSISSSSTESFIKNVNQKKINIKKEDKKRLNENLKDSSIVNRNSTKLKNINSNNSKTNRLRNDSYCNSIENKRRFLGLEFKPNIKRELSIQTEKNSERKNKLLKRFKFEKKFNNFIDKENLIKVKKRNIFNDSKQNTKKKNISNLLKYKTMTDFNSERKNEINNKVGKKMNYHIYI